MSRARKILDFVEGYASDPEEKAQHDLNLQKGYTYQDKGQKDKQGDTKKADGTKPSGTR